jgi:hypothetical protein
MKIDEIDEDISKIKFKIIQVILLILSVVLAIAAVHFILKEDSSCKFKMKSRTGNRVIH